MAAAAILNFWIYKMLLADSVLRAQKHHCAKFCQNRSFCCGDNAIFRIFKMAAAARVEAHQHAKYRQNWSIGCEDINIFQFFKMAAGFVWNIFGPLTASTWGSSSLCKIWFLSMQYFYNMNVSIFGVFGWITPIHTPKIGVLGQFDPLNGLQSVSYTHLTLPTIYSV